MVTFFVEVFIEVQEWLEGLAKSIKQKYKFLKNVRYKK